MPRMRRGGSETARNALINLSNRPVHRQTVALFACVAGCAAFVVGCAVSLAMQSNIWPIGGIMFVPIGAVIGGVVGVPFAIRHTRRDRMARGLCPKCAYPVGTSDKCTECGAPVNRIRR